MLGIEKRVDILTQHHVLQPPKLENLFEREQAIGEARGLISVDEMVRLKIAEVQKELEEYERPDATAAKSESVSDDEPVLGV